MRSCHCQLGRRPPGPAPGSLVGRAGATNTMPSTRSGALHTSQALLQGFWVCGVKVCRQRVHNKQYAQHVLGRPAYRIARLQLQSFMSKGSPGAMPSRPQGAQHTGLAVSAS